MRRYIRGRIEREDTTTHEVGERVRAKWGTQWYDAVVQRRMKGGLLRVLWTEEQTYSDVHKRLILHTYQDKKVLPGAGSFSYNRGRLELLTRRLRGQCGQICI